MKKTFTILGVCSALYSYSQYGELINSSFENWSLDTAYVAPDNWSCSNADYGGVAQNTIDTTDAVDGSLSVYMETVQYGVDTIFGYVMLGLPGQNGPGNGIGYTAAVDSIVGYWKYQTMGNDSVTILTQQRISGTPAFFMKKLAGSQTTWKRFSFPLPLTTGQDSIMVAFASGNAMANFSVPGTWMMVDKVQLKSGNTYATNLPNYSFENWSPATAENPDNWDSFNANTAALGYPTITKSTFAHTGSFAAQISTLSIPQFNDTVRGVLTKGPVMNVLNGLGGISYGANPTSFDGFYQYNPSGVDTARFNIVFYNNQAVVGGTYFEVTNNVSSYTSFNQSLLLSATPDSLALVIFSGNNPGSTLLVDDINLSGGNVSVTEQDIQNFKIYPTVTSSTTTISFDSQTQSDVEIFIYDLNGKLMGSKHFGATVGTNTVTYDLTELSTGSYIVKTSGISTNYSGIVTKK